MPEAVADPSERLPWLSEPARPQPRQPQRSWLPLVVAVSAAGAIAFGGWTVVERTTALEPVPVTPARTVPLPPPTVTTPTDAEPQAPSVLEREALRPAAEPAAIAPVSTKRPKPAPPRSGTTKRARPPQSQAARVPAAAAPPYEPRAWNSGVRGRIIQLGAFQTSAQAQTEWKRVYSRYPLLRPLSPRVLRSRIRGRTYHRLQLGTFSQAHSELLCQRLRATGQGCIVLGLPARGRRR